MAYIARPDIDSASYPHDITRLAQIDTNLCHLRKASSE
jgi:hypothetical protein